MKVLVVLPTYNEIGNIEKMLRTLRAVTPTSDILVVDDGSPDGTADVADKVAEDLGGISVLRRSGKGGLGSAYRAGFAWGLERDYDALVEIDCDFSHDPAALPGLIDAAQDFGLVIGSRYVPGGAIPSWSTSRLLLSRGGNWYASFMLKLGVSDSTAGYRVYRSEALTAMNYETVTTDGYGFQIEMTYRARRAGVKIAERPITFIDRTEGESKMSSNIVTEALWMVTKWGLRRFVGLGPKR